MEKRLIVESTEIICCPKCGGRFPIANGITQQTLERYENDLRKELDQQTQEMRERIAKEEKERAEAEIGKFRQKVVEEKARTEKELQEKLIELTKENEDKDGKLKHFREQELALLREKKQLQEAQQELELKVEKQISVERSQIEERVRNLESEKFKMREAELKKKIEDAQKATEDMRKKLEQGSQQLQGEVLEMELEELLKNSFPMDRIEPVKKGARGADILHTVTSRIGQPCGMIIWEAKRAENWSNSWVQKLKDDQQEARAEIAVLVSNKLPKDVIEPFCRIDNIWVVTPLAVRPFAEAMRLMLLEANKLKLLNQGKNEKAEALYQYLSSPQFSHKMRGIVEAFTAMKDELESEKKALVKIWQKREKQLERVTNTILGICGEMEGLSQDIFPELKTIGQLPEPQGESQE